MKRPSLGHRSSRYGPVGLYPLDELEAIPSIYGCLAILTSFRGLAGTGSQFVIASNSPILLAARDRRNRGRRHDQPGRLQQSPNRR